MKFEKVTASCIVVILFHAGFELILLCDIWGGEGWGWGGQYLISSQSYSLKLL